ncbi:MAG: hypothetical protein BWY36_00679 [Candidatus Diapherotrites archaeon ADurb.Bin253]|nr:MAG: hypothetical protein BWY36_00679 [Candidatus Diapherotrites archaeon ADurb.Bin253]
MNYRKFVKWAKEYERLSKFELKRTTGQNVIIPLNFDRELLQQYIAYKNELRTRQLVIATWALAGASILISILSLFIKF